MSQELHTLTEISRLLRTDYRRLRKMAGHIRPAAIVSSTGVALYRLDQFDHLHVRQRMVRKFIDI